MQTKKPFSIIWPDCHGTRSAHNLRAFTPHIKMESLKEASFMFCERHSAFSLIHSWQYLESMIYENCLPWTSPKRQLLQVAVLLTRKNTTENRETFLLWNEQNHYFQFLQSSPLLKRVLVPLLASGFMFPALLRFAANFFRHMWNSH